MKSTNEYADVFRQLHLYDNTPKTVFAAVALSMCYMHMEGESFEAAVARFLVEWDALHRNGIVPQKPAKLTETKPNV